MERRNADLSDLPPSYEEATGTAVIASQSIIESQQRSNFDQERPLQSGQSNINNNTSQIHNTPQIHNNVTRTNQSQPNRTEFVTPGRLPTTTNTANSSSYNRSSLYGTVCPSCRQYTHFRYTTEINLKTHVFAFVLFALGCFMCSCLPYIMSSCKTVHMYCSHCNYYLGSCDGFTGQRSYNRF